MGTPSAASNFTVNVEGIGAFTFRHRNLRIELSIQAEFSRVCEGIDTPNAFLSLVGDRVATLRVLTVKAPEGWDLDSMDPLDDETYTKLGRVFEALRAKEDSFRGRKKPASEGERPEDGQEPAVLVSPEVQPGAD